MAESVNILGLIRESLDTRKFEEEHWEGSFRDYLTLVEENLTPEEVFLVSRVNGSWDLKSIISISPLREVDALRIIKNLKERGILDLKKT